MIDVGDSPALVRQLFADSLPAKLCFWIVKLPSVHFLFIPQRFMAESVEFLDGSQSAGSKFDKLKRRPGNIVVCEVERDKGEIATSDADGW